MDIEELISIVTLKKIGDNKFEGQNYKTVWGRIFGGQVLSQSLHAAYQTVPEDRIAHSMHGYFILPGDLNETVTYEVDNIRNGGSFTTRRVVAFQKGRAIFNMAASFQKDEEGYDHQIQKPNVLSPDLLLTDFEQAEKFKDELAERYQIFLAAHPKVFDFKPVGTNIFLRKENALPINHCWFRLKDKIEMPLQFHQRGYNIESLNVAPVDDGSYSRLTVSTRGTESAVEQIMKQINKLIDIIKVSDLTEGEHHELELALIKLGKIKDLKSIKKKIKPMQ